MKPKPGPGSREVYLDNAATTRPHPEVAKAMRPYLEERFGNPSALYSLGRESRVSIENARAAVAGLINASAEEIYFTSGGSESDNMALAGTLAASAGRGDHVVTTAVEHHAVLETAVSLEKRGWGLTVVPVDRFAMVDPEDVRRAIAPGTVVVSVMHANNEVGTVEPLAEISALCREAGVYLHTDAVQTVGNIPVDVEALGVDLLSLSAHKLCGPKGVGAIYVRNGTRISRFVQGGDQERGMRAGTENIAGIVGLGKAAEMAAIEMEEKVPRTRRLRDRLVEGLTAEIGGLHLNGHPEERLPNNAHFRIDFIEGEAVCLQLDTLGIFASTGSACSSEALEPSHVLVAMGIDPRDAQGSVRFSLGRSTTEEDVDYVIERLPGVVSRLRSMSPFAR